METDEIYKYIGCALVFLFIIYIISRTIRTNTRIIEGMKSTKKSKKDDEEEPDEDEDWVNDAKDKIKEINKDNNKYNGLYKRNKDIFNDLFDAKRKWLNTAYLNTLYDSIDKDTLDTNQGTLLAWKTQIDLIDYAIANKGGNSGGGNSGGGNSGGNSGGNKGGGDKEKKKGKDSSMGY